VFFTLRLSCSSVKRFPPLTSLCHYASPPRGLKLAPPFANGRRLQVRPRFLAPRFLRWWVKYPSVPPFYAVEPGPPYLLSSLAPPGNPQATPSPGPARSIRLLMKSALLKPRAFSHAMFTQNLAPQAGFLYPLFPETLLPLKIPVVSSKARLRKGKRSSFVENLPRSCL